MNDLTPELCCSWCGRKLDDSDSFVVMDNEGFHNQPQRGDTKSCAERELASRPAAVEPSPAVVR
jgi:hypothetical protein